eukprot:5412319-Amphidinium_carterae.1
MQLRSDREPGLVPRCLSHLDDCCKRQKALHNLDYSFGCSLVRMKNGKVLDMLAKAETEADRRRYLREQPGTGAHVEQLTVRHVDTPQEAGDIFGEARGQAKDEETRSYRFLGDKTDWLYIVHVTASQRSPAGEVQQRASSLMIVVTASVDKVPKNTPHPTYEFPRWSTQALMTTIDALSKRNRHIPYRDSPLTRLLKESLGGHHRAAFVVTISRSATDSNVLSLRVACRAMQILNRPKAAEWCME